MKQDEHETPVLFRMSKRKEPEGSAAEITAVFPCEPHDFAGRWIVCYAHLGQHGSCDHRWYITRTRPATSEEYADLKRELESVCGYRLKVYKRMQPWMREKFNAEVRRVSREAQNA